ncbi:hypothetical protein [Burkholderia stagnalis]|uniref:hypothetical protein n=1 Tax=Burkholderia stagnalis TaxID=1503054 RepID=UPI000AD7490D|nr:hypothetical protein [Burkholderia stagnalis]
MKTSTFINVNAPKLHMLLDSNRSAAHKPELLDELSGLVGYISDVAPATREYGESLIEAANRYYGPDAHQLERTEQDHLAQSMRTAISLIATRSAAYARDGD